jgi:hypothetical protein
MAPPARVELFDLVSRAWPSLLSNDELVLNKTVAAVTATTRMKAFLEDKVNI